LEDEEEREPCDMAEEKKKREDSDDESSDRGDGVPGKVTVTLPPDWAGGD